MKKAAHRDLTIRINRFHTDNTVYSNEEELKRSVVVLVAAYKQKK